MSLTHPLDNTGTSLRSSLIGRVVGAGHALLGRLARSAGILAPLAARFAIALPFLRSGLTKWSGWFHVSPAADFLFESLFKLHLFGHLYHFPVPDLLAHFDAVAEVALPILLMAGLATRIGALGLLVMVGVIQLTVPSGWENFHLPWAALALSLVTLGPGPLSLDWLLARGLRTWTARAAHAEISSRRPPGTIPVSSSCRRT